MPPTPDPSALLDRLRALPLDVADAACAVRAVPLASYPGGARPSALVTLIGGGTAGHGEHVAWTLADHAALAEALPRLARRGRTQLAAWCDGLAGATPYARAALEAAAVDLALRQGRTTLFRLAGAPARSVRYVVSFDRSVDPVAEGHRAPAGVGLKLDVDPGWDDATWAALAASRAVAILDWKGGGTVADHERAHAAMPEAWLEDPAPGEWTAGTRARVTLDATILNAGDVARLAWRPAAVNVKPARLGGVFAALATIAACTAAGIPVYLGGMFEVGVGRRQLHALAALFAPDAPNDVAPLGEPAPWPARIPVDGDAPGFGT